MEGKKNNEAKGVMRIYPNAPHDFCGIPHGTRLRFIGTEHDGSFVFEYEMPEVDDEKMVDAIRMSLTITMSKGALYPGCDITIEQAFAWLERKKAKTTELPKLRESEDERIRRTLAEYFGPEVQLDLVRGVPIQKIRDWLEKQKEQKPKNILTDDDSLQTAYLKGQTDVLEDPEAYGLQKEQKPAEWSKEDEKTIDDAYCWLCEYAGSLIQKNYGKSSMLYGIANKLKSLCPSWKPSEEQMLALEKVLHRCPETFDTDKAKVLWGLFEQLKKLI